MKEASWSDCIDKAASVKITPDKEIAKSLVETADERIKVVARDLNEKTANFIFEDYYSSILEMLHAIILLDGYKVDNHVCLGYYLRDVLRKEHLFRAFDDCRFKRNALIYYGKRMDFETAKDAIKKAKNVMNELHAMLQREMKRDQET